MALHEYDITRKGQRQGREDSLEGEDAQGRKGNRRAGMYIYRSRERFDTDTMTAQK
jgi:hypothetical protein